MEFFKKRLIKKAYSMGGINRGESYAAYYLKRCGYKILNQNYSVGFAEIDLIAKKKNVLSFVEVKQRKDMLYGTPGQAVTPAKQWKIRKAAQMYLAQNKIKCEVSFDVVEIYGSCSDEKLPKLVHIKGAF